jgi:hypothetical protein
MPTKIETFECDYCDFHGSLAEVAHHEAVCPHNPVSPYKVCWACGGDGRPNLNIFGDKGCPTCNGRGYTRKTDGGPC